MRIDFICMLLSALMCVAFSQLRVSNKYVFVPEKVNWRDAQVYCRQHYTDIATVNNQQDNDNVLKTLANENGSGTTPLIWSDGSKFTYADWEPGQPSNNNNIQWCVNIYEKHWNDQESYFKFPFVCHLERKQKILRVELKSGQNLNDPAMNIEILAKMEQILKEKGLKEHIKLSWITQSNGNVFQKKLKSDPTEQPRINKTA